MMVYPEESLWALSQLPSLYEDSDYGGKQKNQFSSVFFHLLFILRHHPHFYSLFIIKLRIKLMKLHCYLDVVSILIGVGVYALLSVCNSLVIDDKRVRYTDLGKEAIILNTFVEDDD